MANHKTGRRGFLGNLLHFALGSHALMCPREFVEKALKEFVQMASDFGLVLDLGNRHRGKQVPGIFYR